MTKSQKIQTVGGVLLALAAFSGCGSVSPAGTEATGGAGGEGGLYWVEVDGGTAGTAGTSPDAWVDTGGIGEKSDGGEAGCAPRGISVSWKIVRNGAPLTCADLEIDGGAVQVSIVLEGTDLLGQPDVALSWAFPCDAGAGVTTDAYYNGPQNMPVKNPGVPPAGAGKIKLGVGGAANGYTSPDIAVDVPSCGIYDLGSIEIDVGT
jgi:hypothetical protein